MLAACMTLKTANSSIALSFLVGNELHCVKLFLVKMVDPRESHRRKKTKEEKEEMNNVSQWLRLQFFSNHLFRSELEKA